MQDKAVIIMEPEESNSNEMACLYLEHSVFGIVSLINMFNMESDKEYQLYLLDDDGGSVTENISSNYKMFKLPKNFSLKGEMYAELYAGNKLVLSGKKNTSQARFNDSYISDEYNLFPSEKFDTSGSVQEWASATGQEHLLKEAINVIEKCKKSPPCHFAGQSSQEQSDNYESITNNVENKMNYQFENNTNSMEEQDTQIVGEDIFQQELYSDYYDIIGGDFDILFEAGKREEVLESIFKNSQWSKMLIDDKYICLGKIYKKPDYNYGAMPDIVAIAIPMVAEKQTKTLLGRYSTFVRAKSFNDFGFMVLLQEAKTGKAIKIIKNKG